MKHDVGVLWELTWHISTTSRLMLTHKVLATFVHASRSCTQLSRVQGRYSGEHDSVTCTEEHKKHEEPGSPQVHTWLILP